MYADLTQATAEQHRQRLLVTAERGRLAALATCCRSAWSRLVSRAGSTRPAAA